MNDDTFRWLMWEQMRFVKHLQLNREHEFEYLELKIADEQLLNQYMVHGNPFIDPKSELMVRAQDWLDTRVDPHCTDELVHTYLEYWTVSR